MGIPGFNVWFSKEYAKSYVPLGNVRVDHLYIDLNSVLHTVMRKAKSHNHFHKLLHKRLNRILEITQPNKSVMIAVDGPAPLAKLLTQRDRRKKAGRTMDEGETLTGAAITPGTTLMLDLTHSLTYYCCCKISSKKFRHVAFELSDGTVMGEGEVKVLGRLARHWHPEDPNDTHVILGDDADLILMALTSYKENLFVANSGLNDGRLDARVPVFSVNLLHQQWASGMLAGILQAGKVPLEAALLHTKLDLTLVAIISKGNDYLPGLRGVTMEGAGGSGLWNCYQTAASQYGRDDGADEGANGGAGATGGKARGGRAGGGRGGGGRGDGRGRGGRPVGQLGELGSVTSIDPATGVPRLEAAALAQLLRMASGPAAGGSGADEWRGSKAAADPQLFLRGCVWLLQMYITGQCPDYRFYYDGVAPAASAVAAACDAAVAAGHKYITLDTFGGPTDPRATRPLLPVACALALLPPRCNHLAAPCVRHLMTSPRPSRAPSEDGSDEAAAASGQTEAAEGGGRMDGELYEELYGECQQCREMAAEVARLQRVMMHWRNVTATAAKRLDAVLRGTAPIGEADEAALEAEVEAAEGESNSAKSKLSSLEDRRKRHISAAHPYRRFPIEKLEAAAEAALAGGRVSPEERAATTFGRPCILRAFNSRGEATAFVRSQSAPSALASSAAGGGGGGAYTPGRFQQQPHQQQQHRQGSSLAAGQQSQSRDHDMLYNPPPPPFLVDYPAYFASIVRMEVLYDEHGSEEALQLRLAPQAPGEVVSYLASYDEMGEAQQQQQRPQMQQPSYSRQHPQGQGMRRSPAPTPYGSSGAAVGYRSATAPKPPARAAAVAPSAAAQAAAKAAATAATTAGTASPGQPSAVVEVVMDGRGGLGAAKDAVASTNGASAAAAAAVAVAVATSAAHGKQRGRPKGSKNIKKSKSLDRGDGSGGGGGGGDGGADSRAEAVASAAAAATTAVRTGAAAVTATSSTQRNIGAPPPPMPSSRLLSSAATGHQSGQPYGGMPQPSASYDPLRYQQHSQQQGYGQWQGQQQSLYGNHQGYNNGYGAAPQAQQLSYCTTVRPQPPPAPLVPHPYRQPMTPAAAAQGRGRTAAAPGPRWT